MRDYRNIIQQVANKNGVSYAEAYRDMQEAVSAAYHSDDPGGLCQVSFANFFLTTRIIKI
jgi:hypothetical protein